MLKSAILLTQDDMQTLEAQRAGVKSILHTVDLLDGFKRQRLIVNVRSVVEEMEHNGERFPKVELDRLLRRAGEPVIR